MAVFDSLKPSQSQGPFSRVGVSMNCSWAVKSAECRPSSKSASIAGFDEAKVAACSSGTSAVPGAGHDVVRQYLAGVVDLEVPEAEVVERMEFLDAATLDVRIAHVCVLGPVLGRNLPGGAGERLPGNGLVEEVPGVHLHEPPGDAVAEPHGGHGRVDLAEIGDERPRGEPGQRDGMDGLLDDTGPHRDQVCPRGDTRWPEDARVLATR